ncbi:hypothetical protein [Erythrobacter sp. BLCC-B19]|uniref:hypothetical protein n=1 Tax=Erythrobacter sp. BLCC-B19 TaxID=3025315 RepID=UPI002360627B|nr:hypothetical protein [Erythrobacter sp. BLCC-B19]WDA42732.1 hypothetical protein PS060_07965 [Erythrobacter sp. BLCC-B19]
MSAVRRSTADQVAVALIWATLGGALIGGVALTIGLNAHIVDEPFVQEPLSLILGPLGIGAFSLFVVAPCTIIFGLVSGALINHLRVGRWAALAICLAAATATQIACVRLFFWDEWREPADFLFTTPFAWGAAVVLWWRLTRERREPA